MVVTTITNINSLTFLVKNGWIWAQGESNPCHIRQLFTLCPGTDSYRSLYFTLDAQATTWIENWCKAPLEQVQSGVTVWLVSAALTLGGQTEVPGLVPLEELGLEEEPSLRMLQKAQSQALHNTVGWWGTTGINGNRKGYTWAQGKTLLPWDSQAGSEAAQGKAASTSRQF